jgi:hypothetical protein
MPHPDFVVELIKQLDADQREAFEERAAIMEFDAHVPREQAELLALLDVLQVLAQKDCEN